MCSIWHLQTQLKFFFCNMFFFQSPWKVCFVSIQDFYFNNTLMLSKNIFFISLRYLKTCTSKTFMRPRFFFIGWWGHMCWRRRWYVRFISWIRLKVAHGFHASGPAQEQEPYYYLSVREVAYKWFNWWKHTICYGANIQYLCMSDI